MPLQLPESPVAPAPHSRAIVFASGGGLGDALLAVPVMRAMRGKYAHISAFVSAAQKDVIAPGAVDEILVDPGGGIFALARLLRAQKFDAAVITWSTARIAYAVRLAQIPERVGQARRMYSPLFTKRVVVRSETGDRTTHWSQILLDYARALGCDGDPQPPAPITESGRAEAAALLADAHLRRGEYILVHPSRGVSADRPAWPTSALAQTALALTEHFSLPIVVSGSIRESAICAGVARRSRGTSFAGKASIAAFTAIAESARLVVAMDSGPMHLAAATGTPTVGIFAMQPDEPDRWRPLGPRTAVVRPTYPCPRWHTKENCPDFACVRAMDVQSIVTAAAGLLDAEREPMAE